MTSKSSELASVVGNVEVVDPWACPAGGVHAWIYRGNPAYAYRCTKCSNHITKARLKGETDDA